MEKSTEFLMAAVMVEEKVSLMEQVMDCQMEPETSMDHLTELMRAHYLGLRMDSETVTSLEEVRDGTIGLGNPRATMMA